MHRMAVIALGCFALLGGGCAKKNVIAPLPLQTIPTPTVSSTSEVVIPAGWQTAQGMLGGLSVSYPGTVLSGEQPMVTSTRERLLTVDLGTAVESPGGKAVPRRTFYVDRLLLGDEYYDIDCAATSTGLGVLSSATTTIVPSTLSLCARSFADAGAGNIYTHHEASVFTMRGGYVVGQITHSVQCANFERPEEQCVPYDEARDAALYQAILRTIR